MEIILPDGTVETYKFDKDYVDEVIDAGWLSFYAEAGDLIGFTLDKDGEIDSLYFTDRTDGTLVGDYRSTKVNPKSFYWETNYGDKFAVINAEKQRIAIDKDGNPATEDYDVYYVDDTTVIYVLSSKTSDNQQYKIDSGKVMAAEDFLTKYDGRINTGAIVAAKTTGTKINVLYVIDPETEQYTAYDQVTRKSFGYENGETIVKVNGKVFKIDMDGREAADLLGDSKGFLFYVAQNDEIIDFAVVIGEEDGGVYGVSILEGLPGGADLFDSDNEVWIEDTYYRVAYGKIKDIDDTVIQGFKAVTITDGDMPSTDETLYIEEDAEIAKDGTLLVVIGEDDEIVSYIYNKTSSSTPSPEGPGWFE